MYISPVIHTLSLFTVLLSCVTSGDSQVNSSNIATPVIQNLRIENCENYPINGHSTLRKEVTSAIAQGMRCLQGIGEQSKEDATKLARILESDDAKNVRCVRHADRWESAESTLPGSPGYPKVEVNLTAFKTYQPSKRRQILFHEIFHWIGYGHATGFDLTHMIDNCCFANSSTPEQSELKSLSCRMARDRPDWKTESYHRNFSRIINLSGGSSRYVMLSAVQAFIRTGNSDVILAATSESFLKDMLLVNRIYTEFASKEQTASSIQKYGRHQKNVTEIFNAKATRSQKRVFLQFRDYFDAASRKDENAALRVGDEILDWTCLKGERRYREFYLLGIVLGGYLAKSPLGDKILQNRPKDCLASP